MWAGPKTSPSRIPSASALAWQEPSRVGKSNVTLFRNWAEHSEWVRAAINVRKTQISSAEWDIVPFNKEEPRVSEQLRKQIKDLFDSPNARADSFRSFIEPIIEDILVLDAGVIEKVRNLRGQVSELYYVDGGRIKVSSMWDGSSTEEPRYWWYPDGQPRASFRNDEMIYIMSNPTTYRSVGLSPMETLKSTIDSELLGSQYNNRQVQNAAPDGLLDLGEGARPEQVDQFKSYWSAEVSGKGAMAFLGGSKNAKFIPFRNSNRDMQFLEWQTYLVRKIAAVFALSPQDLGITFDINRSTADVQQEQSEDRGLRPLLALIQEYLTREIVWDEGFGGPGNNLAFRFTRLNLKESLSRAQMYKLGLAGVSWMTVNEARVADGRQPLFGEQYDQLMVITPTGAVTLDDVPSAREVQEAKSNPPSTGSGTPKEPANSGSGSKGQKE